MACRSSFVAALLGACLFWAAVPAPAAPISRIFAVDIPTFGVSASPTLRFRISFDNAADIDSSTSGIELLDSGLQLDSAFGYKYSQVADTLTVGGMETGTDMIDFSGGRDFYIVLDDVSQTPFVATGLYFDGTAGFVAIRALSTVTVSPVSEPASLGLLLAAAAAGLAASRRAGRRTTAPAAPGSR